MRILYLADFEIPSRSAASVHVMRMCAALAWAGHEVTLLTVSPPGKQNLQKVYAQYGVNPSFKIKSFALPRIPGRSFLYAVATLFYLFKVKPGLIYSRSVVALAISLWRACGVLELHRPVWEYGALYRMLFSYMLRVANLKRVVVISERLRQIHLARFKSDKYFVAHDGANLPVPASAGKAELKKTGQFNAGYAGSIYPGRGLDILVRLAALCPQVTFHLIGGTEDELPNRVVAHIPENVICYGYVEPWQVADYLSKMDVLLAPYQTNTQTIGGTRSADYMSPLKIFEYMSVQKPIIASDLPVLREVLDETCALLVPCNDVDRWREALEKLTGRELAHTLAKRAFERLVSRYTWQVRAKEVLNDL